MGYRRTSVVLSSLSCLVLLGACWPMRRWRHDRSIGVQCNSVRHLTVPRGVCWMEAPAAVVRSFSEDARVTSLWVVDADGSRIAVLTRRQVNREFEDPDVKMLHFEVRLAPHDDVHCVRVESGSGGEHRVDALLWREAPSLLRRLVEARSGWSSVSPTSIRVSLPDPKSTRGTSREFWTNALRTIDRAQSAGLRIGAVEFEGAR